MICILKGLLVEYQQQTILIFEEIKYALEDNEETANGEET